MAIKPVHVLPNLDQGVSLVGDIRNFGPLSRILVAYMDLNFPASMMNQSEEKRNIKIGNRNFGKISVTSGIKEGDLVISEGVSKVRNKTKVKILNTK